MSRIKRAVSLYSFQDEYARKKMSLEDMLKALVDMGVEGFEFISDQMMHNSPFPKESTLKEWDRLLAKYPVRPVCNDIFINTTLYKNRTLTRKESVQLLINEIDLADRLGFRLIRLVSKTSPDIIEPALGHAAKKNVTMALEIHAGMSFDNPLTREYIEVMKDLDSSLVGLVIDFGIFCRNHPRVARNYYLGLGLSPEVADYIDDIFSRGTDTRTLFSSLNGDMPADLKKLFRNNIDEEYAIFSSGYEMSDMSILDDYMPYIKHFHGKFYEMTDEGREYSIPNDEIVRYLDEKGYDGYIASEYEGNRFVLIDHAVESLDQVQKHQAMLKRYIDSLKK